MFKHIENSINNYPGITVNHHEYQNNEGSEHTDSPNVTFTPQLDTRQTNVPSLSRNYEGDEDTNSRYITTTPQLSTHQTRIPPDEPLASNSGISLILQEQLEEQRITNQLLKNMYSKESENVEVNKEILHATETTVDIQQEIREIQRDTHSLIETRHVTEQENTLGM